MIHNIKVDEPKPKETNTESFYAFNRDNYENIKENFKYIIKIKQLKHFLIIFTVFNLIGSLQTTLLSITILGSHALTLFNFGFTVAAVDTIEVLGMIMGSVIPFNRFYALTIEHNLIFEMMMFFVIPLSVVVFPNVYLLLVLIFLSGYFAGISNPKIDAFIIKNLPEDKVGGGMGAFYTIVTFGLPIGSAIAGVLAAGLSTISGWFTLMIMAAISIGYLVVLSIKYSSNV